MMLGSRNFGLCLSLPRDTRYAPRRVPGVEIRASGPDCIFRRIHGVVDSGASRTLLNIETTALLSIQPKNYVERIEGAGGPILYRDARVQFRIPLYGRPPVTFFLHAGVSAQIGENLFGSDFLQYFSVLISPDEVSFLGDERPIEEQHAQ
jgi:hypothetical protein